MKVMSQRTPTSSGSTAKFSFSTIRFSDIEEKRDALRASFANSNTVATYDAACFGLRRTATPLGYGVDF